MCPIIGKFSELPIIEINVQFSYDNEGYIKEVKIDKVNGIINIVY